MKASEAILAGGLILAVVLLVCSVAATIKPIEFDQRIQIGPDDPPTKEFKEYWQE
jgi:hypothetical protein